MCILLFIFRFLFLFSKSIQHGAIIAGTWCKWCSYCFIHRQLTQSKRSNTSYNATRYYLSIGCGITEYGHTKSGLNFHLRHEFIQIFQFWLRTVTAHSKFTQSKSSIQILFLISSISMFTHHLEVIVHFIAYFLHYLNSSRNMIFEHVKQFSFVIVVCDRCYKSHVNRR